jgi:hypothetical protein
MSPATLYGRLPSWRGPCCSSGVGKRFRRVTTGMCGYSREMQKWMRTQEAN